MPNVNTAAAMKKRREAAQQVQNAIKKFAPKGADNSVARLFGGMNFGKRKSGLVLG